MCSTPLHPRPLRRAWVSADGKDEVFEGFFSVDIGYASTCICSAIDDNDDMDSLDVYLPIWGIRACVRPDGQELRLGTTGGDDESVEMRNLGSMLAGAALKHALKVPCLSMREIVSVRIA